MKIARRIRVVGESFEWRFTHYKQGETNYSYLLVTPSNNPRSELIIRFFLEDESITQEMLKSGFITTKRKASKEISLIQPQLIAEIITYMIEEKGLDFTKKRVLVEDGENLLNEMGYLF